jgi:HSP20 family protein
MRTLARFHPFTSLAADLDRFFDPTGLSQDLSWAPRTDVVDRSDALMLRVEVPGVPADTIDVTIDDGTLVISGERSFGAPADDGEESTTSETTLRREIYQGRFRRSLRLPDGLDLASIAATSRHGILEVTIPKSPEVAPTKIEVQAS